MEQRSDSGGGEGQVAEKRDTDAKRPQRREKTEEGQSREEPMRRSEDRDEEGHEEQSSALEETRNRSRGWGYDDRHGHLGANGARSPQLVWCPCVLSSNPQSRCPGPPLPRPLQRWGSSCGWLRPRNKAT